MSPELLAEIKTQIAIFPKYPIISVSTWSEHPAQVLQDAIAELIQIEINAGTTNGKIVAETKVDGTRVGSRCWSTVDALIAFEIKVRAISGNILIGYEQFVLPPV